MPTKRRRLVDLAWLNENKFFVSTPLAGFRFISLSNSRLETVLWYFIIVFFAFLTVLNVTRLTNEFRSGATVISMKTGTFQDMPYVPRLEGIFYFQLPFLNPDFYSKTEQNSSIFANVPSMENELNQTLARYNSPEKILTTQWSYFMLVVHYEYYKILFKIETLKDGRSYQINQTSLEWVAVMAIRNHTHKLLVTEWSLWEKFLKELARITGLKIVHSCTRHDGYRHERQERKEPLMVTTIQLKYGYSDRFVFTLKPNVEPLCSRWVKVEIDSSLAGRDLALNDSYGIGFADLALAFPHRFSPKQNGLIITLYGQSVGVKFGTRSAYEMKTTRLFKKIPKRGQSPCMEADPRDECRFGCYQKEIAKSCNCTSVPYGYVENNNRSLYNHDLCSVEIYSSCNKTSKRTYCHKYVCGPLCSHNVFELQFENINKIVLFEQTVSDDQLYLSIHNESQTEFPVFVEEFSQSWPSFWAELGGTLDIYLGVTVIAVLHLVVYVIKQIAYALSGETKTGQRVLTLFQSAQSELAEIAMAPLKVKGSTRRVDIIKRVEKLEESMRELEGMLKKLMENI